MRRGLARLRRAVQSRRADRDVVDVGDVVGVDAADDADEQRRVGDAREARAKGPMSWWLSTKSVTMPAASMTSSTQCHWPAPVGTMSLEWSGTVDSFSAMTQFALSSPPMAKALDRARAVLVERDHVIEVLQRRREVDVGADRQRRRCRGEVLLGVRVHVGAGRAVGERAQRPGAVRLGRRLHADAAGVELDGRARPLRQVPALEVVAEEAAGRADRICARSRGPARSPAPAPPSPAARSAGPPSDRSTGAIVSQVASAVDSDTVGARGRVRGAGSRWRRRRRSRCRRRRAPRRRRTAAPPPARASAPACPAASPARWCAGPRSRRRA